MRRVADTAHGVLSAASATASLGIVAVGVWFHVTLGRAPRVYQDDIPTLAFGALSWTTLMLMAVAWVTAPVLAILTFVRLLQLPSEDSVARHLFVLRTAVVAVAWIVAFCDPTGAFEWLLD